VCDSAYLCVRGLLGVGGEAAVYGIGWLFENFVEEAHGNGYVLLDFFMLATDLSMS
jgi:hypothetical protein